MVNKIKNIILTGVIILSGLILFSPLAMAADDDKSTDGTAVLPDDWKIEDILNLVLTVVTTGVGIASVGAIAVAGVLYMTAANNSGQVQRAKQMIFNTVIGIIAYILMWAFIQWLIPGGVI